MCEMDSQKPGLYEHSSFLFLTRNVSMPDRFDLVHEASLDGYYRYRPYLDCHYAVERREFGENCCQIFSSGYLCLHSVIIMPNVNPRA